MLLFDLDGTLIDSNGVWVTVDECFLSRRGLRPTPEYCHTPSSRWQRSLPRTTTG